MFRKTRFRAFRPAGNRFHPVSNNLTPTLFRRTETRGRALAGGGVSRVARPPEAGPAFPRNRPDRSANPKVFLGFAYYLPALHRGVARCARERRWDLQTNANEFGVPADVGFDGVLLQYGSRADLDALAHGHPGRVVDFTRREPSVVMHRVHVDASAAGAMAAEYLLAQGHREFAIVEGWHWADATRRKAFADTLAAAGFSCATWDLGELSGRRPGADPDAVAIAGFLEGKLAATSGPIAVFCLHDSHADMLLRVARDLGFAVPERLAVLGCDNEELLCECSATPLSSIDPDYESIGYEAALRLDALMRGAAGPVRETGVPPLGVVERRSTGRAPVGDPLVARALELIGDRRDPPPDVKTLARGCGVNRRALERAFRTVLGKSPLEYLIGLRVDRAARIMRENPGMGGPLVSEKLGYASVAHFYRQFAKVKGMPVDEFRRRFTARGARAERRAGREA